MPTRPLCPSRCWYLPSADSLPTVAPATNTPALASSLERARADLSPAVFAQPPQVVHSATSAHASLPAPSPTGLACSVVLSPSGSNSAAAAGFASLQPTTTTTIHHTPTHSVPATAFVKIQDSDTSGFSSSLHIAATVPWTFQNIKSARFSSMVGMTGTVPICMASFSCCSLCSSVVDDRHYRYHFAHSLPRLASLVASALLAVQLVSFCFFGSGKGPPL